MAEAWLVFTSSRSSGAAVGATFAFRFGPVLFFGLWGGMIADRFDRRRVLLVTQSLAAVLAAVLVVGRAHRRRAGVDAVRGGFPAWASSPSSTSPRGRRSSRRWSGGRSCRTPSRSTARCCNSARITGPALGGLLIATVGTAWVFFGNAVSFFAVVVALVADAQGRSSTDSTGPHERPRVREGLVYAWSITQIRTTIVLVAVVGTLVYNFPTFLTLMATITFHGGAGLAGLLMACLGVGTVIGALSAALPARPTARTVIDDGSVARHRA